MYTNVQVYRVKTRHSLHTSAIHFLINMTGWDSSSLASDGNDSNELPTACLSANMAFSFSVWIKFTRNSLGLEDRFFSVSLVRWLYSSSSSCCSLCMTWSAMLKIFSLVGKQFLSKRCRDIASLWGTSWDEFPEKKKRWKYAIKNAIEIRKSTLGTKWLNTDDSNTWIHNVDALLKPCKPGNQPDMVVKK